MKIVFPLLTVFLLLGLYSCDNQIKKDSELERDYSNVDSLTSYVNLIPHSTDSIFLGIRIGMTKSEYYEHLESLISKGKDITFSESNVYTHALAGKHDYGEAYTFRTSIIETSSDKNLKGTGRYLLLPNYNKEGKLMQLSILPNEDWEGGYLSDPPKWLQSRIMESEEKVKDRALKEELVKYN